jgi:serine phosphatase RsbU (regulator of sigma subunit)
LLVYNQAVAMPSRAKSAAKGSPRSQRAGFRHYRDQLGGFWARVTEGQALEDLWRQFKAETSISYGLYSKEVDWEVVEQESRWKRPFKIGRFLFWALLMKLSPARRLLLLIALLLLVLAILGVRPFGISNILPVAALLVLLALELADRVTMKRDLEIAREIQRWLVPEVPPAVPGVDIAFITRPANTVGGDYYDAFLRTTEAADPPQSLLLVVADVAGKSVPAALLMATFQASLRTLAAAPTTLSQLVSGLNRHVFAHSHGGLRFTTAFLAELVLGTRRLAYINAGHNAPILRRTAAGIERLEAGGPPLGILADADYDCGATTLGPGDSLVIFTDGIVEATNENAEEYGEARLLELVTSAPPESAKNTTKRLLTALDAFVGRARTYDDLTCLVARMV